MGLRNILYASLAVAGLAVPLSSVCYANVLISIDKTTQRMSVSVDGTPRYEWKVSTGRAGYNTPSGTFRPNRMEVMHHSREYENAPMPHSIFFDLHGHAIHGFFDTPHLGMAVSHGCVRLLPAHAATLFDLVKAEGMANTKVVIGGHIPAGGPAVATQQRPAARANARYGQGYYSQRYYGQPAYRQAPYGRGFAPDYGQAYNGRYRRSYYYGRRYYGPPGYQQPVYGEPYPPY